MTIRTASGALGMAAAALLALVAALLLASPVAAAGNQTLSAIASTTNVNPGASFTLTVVQNADTPASGEQVTVNFDQTRLQVTNVAWGADWAASNQIIGVAPNNTVPLATASANADGHLRNVAGYYTPPTTVPTGARTFIVVTFQALANGGSSSITLTSASGIDGGGNPISTSVANADIYINGPISVGGFVETVIPHDSGGLSLWTILLASVGAVAVLGGLGVVGRKVRNEVKG